MRKSLIFFILSISLLALNPAMAGNGLVIKRSPHSAAETLDRLTSILKKKGIRVFARVSHKNNAAGVGLKLRPTELLIFGNPKLGTHFFTSKQAAGIDLPMKALAWTDARGRVWLAYNDPAYIARRHGITNRPEIVKKMTGALKKMTDMAIAQ
jgi:uncharacterized protein (DUF302 family)